MWSGSPKGTSPARSVSYTRPVITATVARRFLLLSVAILLLSQPVDAARWYEDYENAVALIEAGGCSPEAIQLLGAAVTDKPRPRLGARTYAARTVDYLPYYYLARANLVCGNLELATQYLAESRSRNVADSARLDVLQAELDIATAPEPTATPLPAATIDPAALASRRQAADESIRSGRQALADLDRALGRARDAGLADRAWTEERQRLDQRLDDADARRQRGAEAENLLALADAATLATKVSGDARQLRRSVLDAIQPTPTPLRVAAAAPTPTPRPVAPPSGLVGQPSPTPVVTPEILAVAADLYFQGDYGAVLARLESIPVTAPRPRAAALLLRAAAGFAQARISDPETASELMAAARRDVSACRELDAVVRPAPDLFPPDVVAAFSE
jgi:hypothetical protein